MRHGCSFKGMVGKLEPLQPGYGPLDVTFQLDSSHSSCVIVQKLQLYSETLKTPKRPLMSASTITNTRGLNVWLPTGGQASTRAPDGLKGFILMMKGLTLHLAGFAIGLIPVMINGLLSHFESGQSTHAQRAWTMIWLAFGIFYGLLISTVASIAEILLDDLPYYGALLLIPISAPAIGGFVVVAQILMEYGSCTYL